MLRALLTGACMLMVTSASVTGVTISAGAEVPWPTAARPVHDVHLSFTRITVNGPTIVCRVRLFTSDLQHALGRLAGRDSVLVTSTGAVDSLFASYFARAFPLVADGVTLQPRVTDSGDERDAGGEPMRWYVVELAAPGRIRTLRLRAALLFELFSDQRNVVQVVDASTGKRTSFYFAAGDVTAKSVEF